MSVPEFHARILYMEDDAGLAVLLKKRLEQAGHEVDIAVSGEEGLALHERRAYDVLAVDHKMPGKSGLDVIRELAERGPLPPTIMITGAGNETVAVEAMKLGAVDYVIKDVDGYYLEATPLLIDEALKKKRLLEERTRTESVLRVDEQRLELALRGADIGLWDVDLKTGSSFHDDRWAGMLGYNPSEAQRMGLSWDALGHPDDRAALEQAWNDHLEERVPVFEIEHRLRTKSGAFRWALTRGRVVDRSEFGRPTRVAGATIDVHERKTAEENVRSDAIKYGLLFDNAPVGILPIDESGRIIEANARVLEILGFSSVDSAASLNVFSYPPFVEAGISAGFKQCMDDERAVTLEIPYLPDSGRALHLRILLTPTFDAHGRITGAQAVVEDATDSRRAEELLVRTERLRAIADVAGGVAHNFNNVLQVVSGGAHLARVDIEMGEPASAVAQLDEVIESAKNGSEMVKRLQSFAGVRTSDASGRRSTFDFSKTVRHALDMSRVWWKSAPERAGVEISMETDLGEDCRVDGVEHELFGVVVGLIKNAVEALPEGGVIEVSARRRDDRVELEVSDNGVGMTPEVQARMFEPFFTTKGFNTLGMGLAGAYGVIEGHGGDISVESEVGRGTSVLVSLPAVDIEKAEIADNPGPHHKPMNMLVVDDLEPLLVTLKRGFNAKNQTVFTARSGEEALRIFERESVDAIICDLGMPGMNGRQVAARISQICEERGEQRPVFVLLTGWGVSADESEAMTREDVDAIVEKPAEIDTLLNLVVGLKVKRSGGR